MKFKISTSRYFYSTKDKSDYEKLGFKFSRVADEDNPYTPKERGEWSIDDDYASIEINSLEELIKFIKDWGTIVLDDHSIELQNSYWG